MSVDRSRQVAPDQSYIHDLLCSVVTVSMRTLDIIEGLPALDLR